jgi:hypothetical protein
VSTCSLPCSPANRPAPWRWTSFLGQPGGERGAAACATAKRRPRSAVDTRAGHALPTFDHPSQPGRIRAATTKPLGDHSDTSNPGPPNVACPAAPTSGMQRGPDSADAEATDTGRLAVRTPGSHRSPGHRTPGHRTSTRPSGRTSARRTERRTAWPASGHPRRPRRRRRRLGGPNLAGVAASAALGNR